MHIELPLGQKKTDGIPLSQDMVMSCLIPMCPFSSDKSLGPPYLAGTEPYRIRKGSVLAGIGAA